MSRDGIEPANARAAAAAPTGVGVDRILGKTVEIDRFGRRILRQDQMQIGSVDVAVGVGSARRQTDEGGGDRRLAGSALTA